jgi:hypothetical protein
MNRQQKRALQQKVGKSKAASVEQKMARFNQLPEMCDVCSEAFDKKNKEMIQSWQVVVTQSAVRLFCPHCVKKTQEIINEHR